MNRRDLLTGGAAAGAAVLTRCASRGGGGNAVQLLTPGGGARVVAGPPDLASARYFVTVFEELTGTKLEIAAEAGPGNQPVVRIGNLRDDAAFRALAGAERARKTTEQGILLATVNEGDHPVVLAGGGTPASSPGAVGELLNFHLDAGPGRASVAKVDRVDNPALPYRIFWNWDHSTNWVRGVRGEQEDGCVNPYLKRAGAFEDDFRAVLDYMGEHKINGLILWGFLRDSHGGVEGSRKVVDHAFDRGVRVLPGIGSSFYGGIYYEGKNRYNVDTWLGENPPALRFLDNDGKRLRNAICPSKPENLRWLREGADWLFSEFPKLGGANLENGDFFTCQCQDCLRSRARPENDPNFYYDMVVTQLPIIEAARKRNPGAWMTYATYTGFNPAEMWKNTDKSLVRSAVPRFVSQFPEDAICQWTYSHMVEGWGREPEAEVRKKWPAGLRPPSRHSIGLLHQGSQWFGSKEWYTRPRRGNGTGERYVDISELIRYTCLRCAEEGLEGLEILGEVSDSSPANEINYLAFEEFTWRPKTEMSSFVRERLAPIYGGADNAELFLKTVRSAEASEAGLLKSMQGAAELSNHRQFNARQKRRWANLRAELARRLSLVS